MWYINIGDDMIEILLYISNCLIIFAFIGYFFLILFYQNKKITNSDGFNVTKDILHEYDSINIVENKSIFTIYNLKRKVIKIASKCYYGNGLSYIAIPLMEAGISANDNKHNKYLDLFRKLIGNLKCLYILSIIAIIVNSVTYNIVDARIGLFIVTIFSIISYMLINIKSNAVLWIAKNIKKIKVNDDQLIIRFLNNIVLFDKLIFLGELIMIIRFVAILLKFN